MFQDSSYSSMTQTTTLSSILCTKSQNRVEFVHNAASVAYINPIRTTSSLTFLLHGEDRSRLEFVRLAEEAREDIEDGENVKACKDIATAIYLDNERYLKKIITEDKSKDSLSSKKAIQRRILEAVELDSLKCLDVLCKKYEHNPISNSTEINHFHRRYGLSFWPLDERPKETALHILASKIASINAIEILEKQPAKFLNDFLDVEDSEGSTPLLVAVKCNNIEIVKRLLKAKPDVSKRNIHDESPIHIAALNDNADVINEILKTYSDSQERAELLKIMKNIDGKGHSLLYSASQSGKPKVLDLIMDTEDFFKNFMEQEEKSEEWKLFVCNVCAAGCLRLASIILKQHPDLLKKSEGTVVTPLMRAAEANELEIIHLIISINDDYDLFTSCDKNGRNVFHYAVKNPEVLEYLIHQLVRMKEDKAVIDKKDKFNNTPIKLAAVRKLKKSFEILSIFTTRKEDLFSAYLIHNGDIELLKIGLLEWMHEEPRAVNSLLSGYHKNHQPFLEAAKKGSRELMAFFLDLYALHSQRTPKGETAIHCAVLSGNLEAVEYLLNYKKFLEMIDYTDEVNITAAGYATQNGHAEILRCLLENNAQMKSDKKTARLNILDSAYGYFKTGENSLKEIIKFCTKDKEMTMLKELFEDSYFGADCIVSKLVEETPNVAKMLFDLCVDQNKQHKHCSSGEMKVERKVTYSFFPFKPRNAKRKHDGVKLKAIESMVKYKRDNCLGHPLVIRLLNKKMERNIQKWFILNILLYTAFVFTLTTYGVIQSQGTYNLKSSKMIALSVIIFIICAFHFIKEVLQMVLYKTDYINDFENYIELVMYMCAVIYVVPGGNTKPDVQIGAGAIAVFLGWINFSLFIKRFSLFGIYIIMAKRVFLTVCKVLPLVLLFIAAFSFSLCLLMPLDEGFNNVPISILTTFVMMTGDLDYRDTFLASGPLHVLKKMLLVLFILMISIAIMNLLTGLAVGDTNDIMNRSKEEKRIYKATLVLTLERKLHNSHLYEPSKINYDINIEDFPEQNSQCSWLMRQWQKVYDDDELEEQLKAMTNDNEGEYVEKLRQELTKIENRLKNIEGKLD